MTLIVSQHSHGTYDSDVHAKFPTSRDMESDARERGQWLYFAPRERPRYIDSMP